MSRNDFWKSDEGRPPVVPSTLKKYRLAAEKSQLVDSQMKMKLVVVSSSSGSNAINPYAWNIELKFEILS